MREKAWQESGHRHRVACESKSFKVKDRVEIERRMRDGSEGMQGRGTLERTRPARYRIEAEFSRCAAVRRLARADLLYVSLLSWCM